MLSEIFYIKIGQHVSRKQWQSRGANDVMRINMESTFISIMVYFGAHEWRHSRDIKQSSINWFILYINVSKWTVDKSTNIQITNTVFFKKISLLQTPHLWLFRKWADSIYRNVQFYKAEWKLKSQRFKGWKFMPETRQLEWSFVTF